METEPEGVEITNTTSGFSASPSDEVSLTFRKSPLAETETSFTSRLRLFGKMVTFVFEEFEGFTTNFVLFLSSKKYAFPMKYFPLIFRVIVSPSAIAVTLETTGA